MTVSSSLARRFAFAQRSTTVTTEVRAGLATFMVLTMPFTWSITNGIGAGFVTYTAIKVLNGKAGQLHWMVYAASAAFVLYFAMPILERALR